MRRTVQSRAFALITTTFLAISAAAAERPLQILEVQPEKAVKGATKESPQSFDRGLPYNFSGEPGEFAGQPLVPEVEANGTFGTATAFGGTDVVGIGNIFPAADVDFWSFQAAAGDKVYAATQTLVDASASGDSTLDLIASDGSTVLESDLGDGTFNASSSSIAGTVLATAGTYYLRVTHNVPTGTIRPYHLHLRLQSGASTPEIEPNNTTATATAIPASGWVSGTIPAVSPGEADFFSFALAAGDSVFISLDMNPERDASVWNGRLGFGLFGTAPANQILVANDANAGAVATNPNSEAIFFTVRDAGTYFVYVDSIVAAGLGPLATYEISVSVRPAALDTLSCTTYTSTDVPVAIPTGPGIVSSTLTIPGNPEIADLDVAIELNHTFMQDLDVNLVSPAGNDNGLFSDIGAATTGGAQTTMLLTFDDEAALPPAFTLSASYHVQPELAYRLSWYDGSNAGGTWTLTIRDDATGDGGTLTAWSIRVCEPVATPPACAPGQQQVTVYSSDFETDDGGFTHSGVGDEWERGLPAFVPITTCNSGTNCWKTDLDNTYNASSSQDLLSPNIDLDGLLPPVLVSWAQRYHIESATFDHLSVDIREVGPTNATRLFEWYFATMNNTVGNPGVSIPETSGWSRFTRQVDSYAGDNVELLFHLDGDTTVQLAGLAIDDVTVTACELIPEADLAVTKTDGITLAIPGQSTTYTITATNNGPGVVTDGNLSDPIPAGCSSFSWSCQGNNGGTCTANGTGAIDDTIDLPVGGQVTYLATCVIDELAGPTLTNTVTVDSDGGPIDPDGSDNTATDVNDLAIFVDGFESGDSTRWTSTQN